MKLSDIIVKLVQNYTDFGFNISSSRYLLMIMMVIYWEQKYQKHRLLLIILCSMASSDASLARSKGCVPDSRMYVITPNAHMSTPSPTGLDCRTSGGA